MDKQASNNATSTDRNIVPTNTIIVPTTDLNDVSSVTNYASTDIIMDTDINMEESSSNTTTASTLEDGSGAH